MKTVFVLQFAQKEFEGAGFALWRHLWMHHLPKETDRLPVGSISCILLPVSAAEIPFMGQRSRKLLCRRLEEIIPEGALCLSREGEVLPEFISEPRRETIRELGAFFLPEILTCVRRQWGKNLTDGRVSILTESGTFLPLVRTLAPFVRQIDVISPALPDYEEQESVLKEWGLAVSFRQNMPEDATFTILWDGDFPNSLPHGTVTLSFVEGKRSDIRLDQIFFHAPAEFSRLSAALGGLKIEHLAGLKDVFWSEDSGGEELKECGFSVSRVSKFWC